MSFLENLRGDFEK